MKNKFKIFSFVFIIFLRSISSQTSSIKFAHLTIEHGLSQSTVECILQDKTGFMWFGTNDGLNRYDGYEFKTYRFDATDTNSISDNHIYNLIEDSSGFIWAATNKGLNRFDPIKEKFTRYFHSYENPFSINENIIHTIELDKNNNLWIATINNGLNVYSYQKDNFHSVIPVFNNDTVRMISKISIIDGNYLLIGTFSGEVYKAIIDNFKLDNNNPTLLKVEEINLQLNILKLNENIIWDFCNDSNGNLWIGTNSMGLIKFNPITNEIQIFNKKNKNKNFLSDNTVHKIYNNSKNELWIGTKSGGINILYPGNESFTNILSTSDNPDGLNDNGIWSFFEDRSGNMWCGTDLGGINKYDPNKIKFNHYHNKNKFSNNQIWSLFEDHSGLIWIGTAGDGLYSFDIKNNVYKNYAYNQNNPLSISYNIINIIVEDDDRNLWICTDGGGLNKLDKNTFKFQRFVYNTKDDESISNNNIKSAFKSKDEKIWLGTYGGGISLFDSKTGKAKRFFRENDSIKIPEADFAFALLEENGILWIGSYGKGLIKYELLSRKFEIFKNSQFDVSSISNDKINSLFKDSKGNLWIGTAGGLNTFIREKSTFKSYTLKDGLQNDVIYSIQEDNDGLLWLSTNKGLSQFNPIIEKFKNFSVKDGLQAYEFNRGASFKLKNGSMVFGGINGFNLILPELVKSNSSNYPIVLTSFKIMNKDFQLGIAPNYIKYVELNHYQNFLMFEFTYLNYSSARDSEFAYKLEGLDEDWIYSGKNRRASFTQLIPGEYTLKVKASDSFGAWTEPVNMMVIRILPPFWMTWWFRTILLIAFLSIGPIIYYRRVNQLKKEKSVQVEFSKQLIQSQEFERKRIASELHDSLGQDLLVIKNLALLNNVNQSEEISKTASQALDEVRRISYNLHPYQLDRLGLTKAIKSMFNNIEEASKIKFDLILDNVDNVFEKEKEINIYRIIQECVNNIIKHSDAGIAKVLVQKNANKLIIEISDNGIGFNYESVISESKGFGLKNLTNRCSFLNGKINYLSSSEFNTIVKIQIPVI